MSTDAQDAANLLNAQRSTGPTTEEGKAIASRNSLTHGLTAKTVLLPGEDPAEYQTLSDGMFKDLHPANATESALVRELVDLQWRLLRVPRVEVQILSAEEPDLKKLNNLGTYAARLKRQYSATLKELLALRKIFHDEFQERMKKAALLHFADFVNKRPSCVAKFGFDFPTSQIEAFIDERQALNAAQKTIRDRNLFPDV